MEFKGFKLKLKDFHFKNHKEMNKFFDKALIESPFKFIRLQDQLFIEKMHVAFSWMMISRILAFALSIPVIIGVIYNTPQWFGLLMVFISIFFFLRSKSLSKKLNDIAFVRNLFKDMSDTSMDSLEEVRQELINKEKITIA
jgi:hypothetical protein